MDKTVLSCYNKYRLYKRKEGLNVKDHINTKKLISVLLAATISTAPLIPAYAEDDNAATRSEVLDMLLVASDDYNPNVSATDIMHGDENGLRENDPVTRAEALIMLKRAFGDFPELKGNNLYMAIPREDFTDIPEWAEAELNEVFDAGIVAGTGEGKFSPYDNVTHEQMQTFINRVFALYGTNYKDDFYNTINKTLLDNMQMEADEYIIGSLYDQAEKTSEQVTGIINEIISSTPEEGSHWDKVKTFYDNIVDMTARNELGYQPIEADLEKAENIKSVSDILETTILNDTSSMLSLFMNFSAGIDPADSSRYITTFDTPSASLSAQAYTGELDSAKNALLKYTTKLLTLCGEDEETAAANAQSFFDFEKQISAASLTPAESMDIEKTYNIYTLDQLQELFPSVDMSAFFESLGFEDKDNILVSDPGKVTAFAAMFTDENLPELRNYARISIISSFASMLSEDFRNATIEYQNELLGTTASAPIEEEASALISNTMPDYIGEAYADKYCTEEIINDVTSMIKEIIGVYRTRIENLDWMSDTTKEKALLKLDTMHINVGAPEEFDFHLDSADIKSADEGGSLFQNIIAIRQANLDYSTELVKEPIDKTQWITTPQTVNAFYMPQFNSINFPIAFLQEPVYSADASYEQNLGRVGFVIGHEITHAFDSSGAQYDENGNAVNWWTEEDAATFATLCQDVVEFYSGLESAPGIPVDPELTLTENIADLGAISCITEVASAHEGFDLEEMYDAYAVLWASTSTREYAAQAAVSDVHSPDVLRVNRFLQSVDEFYEIYGIEPGDGMYIAPENRARIW